MARTMEKSYEIVKEIGNLPESPQGWHKELNVISWHGAQPKYDLRTWSPNRDIMGKGVTLTMEEILELKELLNSLF